MYSFFWRDIKMPFRTAGGISSLSKLEIDADKDWKGYEISNVTLQDLTRGSVDLIERSISGIATAGDFTVLLTGNAADGETVHIDQATFVMSDGTAVPSGCDAIIATLDNAGGGTSQTTILSGDGSTIYDDEIGNPLASYTNTSGAAQTVAIGVDNGNWNAGSGANQSVQLSVVGVIK